MTNAALLKKVEELSARVAALEADNTRLREENARLREENRLLRQKLDQYIRHYFGGQRNEGWTDSNWSCGCKAWPMSSHCQRPSPNPLPLPGTALTIRCDGCW